MSLSAFPLEEEWEGRDFQLVGIIHRVGRKSASSGQLVSLNPWSSPESTAAAAAAAKSLQLCPTLCDPRDGSPPGSPVPGILQARTLEWVAISFSNA